MGRNFYIRFVFFLASAISASSGAAPSRQVYVPAHLKGPEKEQCMKLLEEAVLGALAPSAEPLRMTIGHLGSLGTVLVRSGAPAEAAAEVVRWLDEQLSLPQTHPVWSNTVEEIRRQKASPTLFACVLRKECQFLAEGGAEGNRKDGFLFTEPKAIHAGLEPYAAARFPELSPPRVPLQERRRPEYVTEYGVVSGLQVILLKFPDSDSQPDWVVRHDRGVFLSDVAHEVTHAADWEVFSQWISANYKLIGQKRFDEVDSLFDALTRELPDGKIIVDEGFVMTFLESRAYSVCDWIEKNHPHVVKTGSITSSALRLLPPNEVAIYVIRGHGGGWFLDRNKIDKDNIFDFGVKLGKRFEKVIRAAGIN